ncbi:MAG: cytochrome c [Caulobacteraceae bacterium]
MSGRMIALAVGLAVAAGGAAHAQDTVALGKARFAYNCAPCHGPGPGDDGKPMLPGTQSLQWKYKGSKPAVLEQRSDLPAPVLRTFVRRGSWSMPAFRKTEVTDAEIDAIAAYLAQSSKAGGQSR